MIHSTKIVPSGALLFTFRLGDELIKKQYMGYTKSQAKADFQRHLLAIAQDYNKILCFTDCDLIFDEVRGIGIYKALCELADNYGYLEGWEDNESVECGEDAMEWLNEEVCIGCRLEWNDGNVWLMRDGFNFPEC